MKRTNVCAKLVLLLLCFTFVFFSMFGCNDELKEQVGNLENNKADAAALAELQELVNQVKATADSAATIAKLEEVAAELDAVKATADASASLTKLEEVKGELEALVAANATADATTKAALEEAIAAVDTLAKAAATKAELEEAVESLTAEIAKKENSTAVKEQIDAVKALVSANGTANEELALKVAALEKAVAEKAEKTVVDGLVEDVKALAKTADVNAKVAELEAKIAADDKNLDDAVKALTTTVNNNTAANNALATKVAELEAAVATKADKATVDALNSKVAELATAAGVADDVAKLNKAIADNATAIEALEAEVAAAKTQMAALATKAEVEAAVNGIKADAAALKTALEDKITALQTEFGTFKTETANKLAAYESKIAVLEEAVKALNSANAGGSFAAFVEATMVLNGDAKLVVDENGLVTKVVTDKESEEWATAVEYSIAAFGLIVVDSNYYVEDDYNAFLAEKADIEFFLGRAISAQAIVDYFAELNAYIANMPDFNETLAKYLAEKTTVTTDEDDLEQIDDLVALMGEKGAELTPENDAAYKAIKAAHENLLNAVNAASAAVDAIDAIGYVVFSTASEDLVKAAEAEIKTLKDTYFINETHNKYYTDNETTIVENYSVLTTACARYDQLVLANANKITVIETALKFGEVRPLWTDKATLDANSAEFAAWCETYAINETADAETILAIYPKVDGVNPIDSLKLATLYADAMDGIFYNTKFTETIVGVEALNTAVAALMADHEGVVLYADYAVAIAYEKNYESLDAAIKFVKLYDPAVEDNNYAEMVKAVAANFDGYIERMTELNNVNVALDAFYNANKALKGKVTFNDWAAIEKLGTDIAGIIEDADVVVDDANYVEFAKENDPFQLQAELVEEYLELTSKVREIYDTVMGLLNESNAMSLAFGNKIQEFVTELANIMALGVTDIDLPLPGKTEDAPSANLETLMTNLETVIAAFVEKAEAAQLAAEDVAAAIATLEGVSTADLNNYDKIVAVKEILDNWVADYLAADVADAKGDVAAAVKAVAKVQVYLGETGTYYVFVAEADYTACVTAMTAAQTQYDKAEKAWAPVEAELERLTALTWNIHNKAEFEAADKAYLAFVKTYYTATGITAAEGEFGELATYAAFEIERDECYAMAADAVGAANVIKGLIEALAASINADNYAEQLDLIDDINTKLEDYKQYCEEICNDCIPEALLITLRQKEATANLYAYAEAAKVKANDATDVQIDKSVSLYSGLILAANNGERTFAEVITTINSTLESAKSAIAKKAPCAVEVEAGVYGEHTYGDDCVCDVCDHVKACVDAADDTDHACDSCGTVIESCADTDNDHKCDVCDAVLSECTDADEDGLCDVCGEAMPVVTP